MGYQLVLSNGLSLRLSVFIFRMCLFPYSLLIIARDIWGAVSSPPPEGALWRAEWSQISSFQSLFFLVATLFLFMLSSMWFVKLSKGAMKALKGRSSSTDAVIRPKKTSKNVGPTIDDESTRSKPNS